MRLTLLLLLFSTFFVHAKSQISLEIKTKPDSATIILNNIKEEEKTPYLNDDMVETWHTVKLIPQAKIFKEAEYKFKLTEGEQKLLEHQFLYRNKSFQTEHMSIPADHFQFELGWSVRSFYEAFPLEATDPRKFDLEDSSGTTLGASRDILHNSIPVYLRYGFSNNVEIHAKLPFAGRSGTDFLEEEVGFGPSDIEAGFKYTHVPINMAMDLTFKYSNGDENNLGTGHNGIRVSLIGLGEKFSTVFYGVGSFQFNLPMTDNDAIQPGHEINVYLQGGYPLKGWEPYLGINAHYQLEDKDKDLDSLITGQRYVIAIQPGMIWEIGKNANLQVSAPFSVFGQGVDKFLGFEMSLATSFNMNKKEAAKITKRKAIPIESDKFLVFDDHEVTNKEYREFCDKTNRQYPKDPNYDGITNYFTSSKYDQFPVVNVSFQDALDYAEWKGKRLPTVEEWLKEFGKVELNLNEVVCGFTKPENVKAKIQNNLMYNIVGNVSEWVVSDKAGAKGSAFHAGNFFRMPARKCVEQTNFIDIATARGTNYIGFRLVEDIR